MAIARSTSVLAANVPASRGESVWSALCRTALRGIEWAADACGAKDESEPVERAELLLERGLFAQVPPSADRAIDWAKLNELERSRVALATGAGAPGTARAD